ncbi:MAG: type II toxin-antitoxin system HicA family toxin [Burkholderiales bacterium]|nr:type II toxin-antitoxin system HicA family toxin [Anaerolineae bacterium]
MSKRDKLRQRIEQNPKNVAFRDLRTLLEAYGFELKRTKGSHHSFVRRIAGQGILLVIPYQQPLQAVYVKKALEFIKQIEAEEEDE